MNIISNNYNSLLKNLILSHFKHNLNKQLDELSNNKDVFNYISLLSSLDNSLCNIAKDSLISIFTSIDNSFRNSTERKTKYHIKAYLPRSIMTIFGEITYTRTYYTDKYNKGSFCYLDYFLGLNKYEYFDPYIRSCIIEFSSDNSYSKASKYITDLIGNRIKFNKNNIISRQAIRYIILKSKVADTNHLQLSDTDSIYIMADEKFVPTQNNDKKDIMIKQIVVFDNVKQINKSYNKLINKQIFSSDKTNDLVNQVLDYIYYSYNTDNIKYVYFMGDGASWIKSIRHEFNFNSNTKVIFSLDKFHYKQAIHHICLDEQLENITHSYIVNDNKKDFIDLCQNLISSYPYRYDTINKKQDYILTNWKFILNSYKYNLKCCMESNISHNLAYLFTSRPKAYSIKMVLKLLRYRMFYKNNHNIKFLYLKNYNHSKQITIDKDFINFDIFDNYKKLSYHSYNQYLYSPAPYSFIY